jgi:hypothetical protein
LSGNTWGGPSKFCGDSQEKTYDVNLKVDHNQESVNIKIFDIRALRYKASKV